MLSSIKNTVLFNLAVVSCAAYRFAGCDPCVEPVIRAWNHEQVRCKLLTWNLVSRENEKLVKVQRS